MDIKKNEVLIAELEQFKKEALKSHIVKVWAETYKNDPFGYLIKDNGNILWSSIQAFQLWRFWKSGQDSQFFEAKNHIEINFDEDREDDSHSYWSGYNQALRELKSIIETQEDAALNAIADSRKDQKRISVNIDDL